MNDIGAVYEQPNAEHTEFYAKRIITCHEHELDRYLEMALRVGVAEDILVDVLHLRKEERDEKA